MDLETLRVVGTLATAFGVGSVIWPATKHVYRRLTGRAQQIRNDVDKAHEQVEKARKATDREARRRRKVEEFASLLIRRLIAAECVDESTIPPWPEYQPDPDTTPTQKE
ncbi:hypothetical protein [Pseudoclavibacter sp. RFBB5]|uniref:hypothetical protein n=1 Tax=Pseudoclavibacter sp. RFBB5 TaxID=2080574 RepID=UPI000CE8BFEC|nr:hypothetical protein [Pseudoclavibacter sp. RFBB5]PPG29627.1 hypothetical protein C5B97_11690 [Pseudoclavibacter sp. RFBB5]